MRYCPMCDIALGSPEAHKTEWFYHSRAVTIVEDLDPKGYVLRLLGVPRKHFDCEATGELIAAIRQQTIEIALGVARAICLERGLAIAQIDTEHHSFRDHWHLQVCLSLR